MIFKRFIIYIVAVLSITACYKFKEPERPKNLISKKKMANILIDLKLIGAATGADKKIIEANHIDNESYIFSKYNVDSLQFAQSNAYYAFHVKDYEDIYNKAKDSIEALKVFYEELKQKEEALKKKRKDSLKRVKKVKDSIQRIKIKDSLKLLKEKDSIIKVQDSIKKLKENKTKDGKLILSVSDIDSLSQ